ncbi:MAG TPA: hypothetical protein VHL14_07080, partial [Steroidobacteraceae bacterium]|nr:hypothetical protein [Steroidobacteraceae bacterium]
MAVKQFEVIQYRDNAEQNFSAAIIVIIEGTTIINTRIDSGRSGLTIIMIAVVNPAKIAKVMSVLSKFGIQR